MRYRSYKFLLLLRPGWGDADLFEWATLVPNSRHRTSEVERPLSFFLAPQADLLLPAPDRSFQSRRADVGYWGV